MKRWRSVTVALLVLALVGSLLALAVPPPLVAGAQAPENTEETHTVWTSECWGAVGPVGQQQFEPLGFTVEHPENVEPDSEFTIRVIPDEGYLPDKAFNSTVGEVTVLGLENIKLMFNLPTNAELLSASIVPDTTYNTAGPYGIAVDESFSPARLVLSVGEVLKNPSLPDNSTPFRHPSFDVTMRATGGLGSTISTRVSGVDQATTGYTFLANNNYATATVKCWAAGNVPAPVLFGTVIASGSTTIPTTTSVTADPTLLPGGSSTTLTANVTTTEGAVSGGAVRFSDGGTTLGLGEVNADGVATFTATLTDIGQRSITATFLGSALFEASTSSPVVVTVTNPANRVAPQIQIGSSNPNASVSSQTSLSSIAISATVLPAGSSATPTGTVHLYEGDTLLFSRALVGGATTFPNRPFAWGGHALRVEYSGDTKFFPASGGWTQVVALSVGTNQAASDVALTGTIEINNATAAVPGSSFFNNSFRTEHTGLQADGTIFKIPSTTFSVPGGTITGRLATVGLGEGGIQNVASGTSWLPDAQSQIDASFLLEVTAADFGSGTVGFASSCAIGPFEVGLSGVRGGTSGALPLSSEGGTFVSPVPAGSCVAANGQSFASQVNLALAGGSVDVDLAMASTFAAGARTVASNVSVNKPYSFVGEPVSMTASVSRLDGTNFANGSMGTMEFRTQDGQPAWTGSAGASGPLGPTKSGTETAPAFNQPALPLGNLGLTAFFLPSNAQRLNYASSTPSASPMAHQVFPLPEKQLVSLELVVQETAASGEPVTAQVRMTPAPNEAVGPAPLYGEIHLFDALEPNPALQQLPIRTEPESPFVDASGDGIFDIGLALAPGPHSLRAVFTPLSLMSDWWWGVSESPAVQHTVSGPMPKTTIEQTFDSLRGSDEAVKGGTMRIRYGFKLGPSECLKPFGEVAVWVEIDGQRGLYYHTMSEDMVLNGLAIAGLDNPTSLGVHHVKVWVDPTAPTQLGDPFAPEAPFNAGCLPSDPIEWTYEIVPYPTVGDPFQATAEIQSIFPTGMDSDEPQPRPAVPALEGVPWSQINGYAYWFDTVGPDGTGVMSYFAENTATDVVTPLGTVNVTLNAIAGGLGRLSDSPATATLPAGTYEVWGEFDPTGDNFLPATTPRFTQQVVENPMVSSTSLAVSPEGASVVGEPVELTATVGPVGTNTGMVEFFDGATSLGTVQSLEGDATLTVFNQVLGQHSYTARFTSANPSAVNGSTSAAVIHQVVEPAVETTTTLEVSPVDHAVEGSDVTLTATVSPADAVGSVSFGDEASEAPLGTVELVDGVATLVIDDLAVGNHELFAEFVPDDALAFSSSESEGVAYIIDGQQVGPVETGTTLDIDPGGSAHLGETVTLTATITPSEAVGSVSFIDGGTTIAGPVPVTGGEAQVVVDDLEPGTHSLSAVFTPTDSEAYEGSASPAQDYVINQDFAEPVFECQGADAFSVGIMTDVVAPPDGILFLETPLSATVPETLANGGSGDVSFSWSVTLPETLANLAIEAHANTIYLEDMDLAMVASGGSEQVWEFPETYTITDPTATITLETSGTVDVSAEEDIAYAMRSPLLITIHVPPTDILHQDVYVKLSCEVHNATQAITEVQGGATAPGAPTGVTATAGPLQANVSWTPPANDGGSPITGYVITSSPDNKVVHTSANVTNIDVIGLTAGQNYTFVVQAVNAVGTGEASTATGSVMPTAGENFTDVQPGHVFYSEIEWLAATGITQGMGDGTFGASLKLTRQAMAAFLYRLEGSPNGADPQCTSAPFPDVPTSNAFCGEISWLKAEGITQVPSDQNFGPGLPLTRQAMSAFLYRLANGADTPPACTTAPFPDVPTTNPFCPQITWMAEVGITQVPSDQNFGPGLDLTRQAMAAFLYRYTLVVPTGL